MAPQRVKEYESARKALTESERVSNDNLIQAMEKRVDGYYDFLNEQSDRLKDMRENYAYLNEYVNAIKSSQSMLRRTGPARSRSLSIEDKQKDEEAKVATGDASHSIGVSHLVGTINTGEKDRLRRIVFRASRGNALIEFKDMDKPVFNSENQPESKTVYIIVFQEGEEIRHKLTGVCDSFSGKRFDIPVHSLQSEIESTQRKITDTRELIQMTEKEMKNYLTNLNDIKS